MTRVLLAPTAVLAHLDPVGIVALGLLCLVVATLALVTGECHSDTHISAGHGSSVVGMRRARRKKDPAGQREVTGECSACAKCKAARRSPSNRPRSRRCRGARS